jgi:hypothetical protein
LKDDCADVTEGEHEVKIAFPLWALGAAALAVGLLTGRKLFMLGGAVAIASDRKGLLKLFE